MHTHWTLALILFLFFFFRFRDHFHFHFGFCLGFVWLHWKANRFSFGLILRSVAQCISNYNNFLLRCPFVNRHSYRSISNNIMCILFIYFIISLTFIISICFSPLIFVYSPLHSFTPMVFIYFCTFIQYPYFIVLHDFSFFLVAVIVSSLLFLVFAKANG